MIIQDTFQNFRTIRLKKVKLPLPLFRRGLLEMDFPPVQWPIQFVKYEKID